MIGLLKKVVIVLGLTLCLGLWSVPVQAGVINVELTDTEGVPAAYTQAMQLRQQGDLVRALHQLEQAAAEAPQSVPVLYELGRAEFQLSRIDNAIAHYRAALAQNPNHAPSAYELGSILVTLGRLDEGIRYLQHSVNVAPTVTAHYNLGIALGRRGDRQGEINSLQHAIALQPDNADAHLNLGLTYARLDNLRAAKDQLLQARNLYQAQIERLEHAHLGRNSLDAQIIDQMIAALDSGCGTQCWRMQ